MGLKNSYERSSALCQLKSRHERISKMCVKDLPGEVWYDIFGFENLYSVSNLSRVKSLKKRVKRKDGIMMFLGERLVKVHKTKDGYLMARISKDNKASNILIHRAIAMAVILNPNSLPEVNHKDGVKTNNLPLNLEWVSHKNNMVHAAVTNLFKDMPKGVSIWCASLSETDVLMILGSKEPYSKIAKQYGVTASTVCSIKTGKTWNHITGLPKSRKLVNNSSDPTERYGLDK